MTLPLQSVRALSPDRIDCPRVRIAVESLASRNPYPALLKIVCGEAAEKTDAKRGRERLLANHTGDMESEWFCMKSTIRFSAQ